MIILLIHKDKSHFKSFYDSRESESSGMQFSLKLVLKSFQKNYLLTVSPFGLEKESRNIKFY